MSTVEVEIPPKLIGQVYAEKVLAELTPAFAVAFASAFAQGKGTGQRQASEGVNAALLAACKAAERIEMLRDEIGACHARINNAQRTETVESVAIARKNLQAHRDELRAIRQSIRAAIALAEGGGS